MPLHGTRGSASIAGFGFSLLPKKPNVFQINDIMVFTSARMHGAVGPNKSITDVFYANYYTQNLLNCFSSQPYNGYQKFIVPDSGLYEFEIMGGYAGHNIWRNSSIWAPDVSQPSVIYTGTSYDGFGCPGRLICRRQLNAGDVLHILIGQTGGTELSSTGSSERAVSGGGASAVFVGTLSSTTTYAIAGGAGAERNKNAWGVNGNSPYGTTGQSGDLGAGGTNSVMAARDPNTDDSSHSSAGGAGLDVDGPQHGDIRAPNIRFLNSNATKLRAGAMGAVSGPTYTNPYTGGGNSSYMCFNVSSNVVTFDGMQASANTTVAGIIDQNTLRSYHSNQSFTISGRIATGSYMGGFGGGGVGSWGGSGGGGGYGGGGAGGNGSPQSSGGGSSYLNDFTFISHDNQSKGTSYFNFNCPTLPAGAFVKNASAYLKSGLWSGNGFVTMKRVG